ncbi:MAG: hypothetical protein OXC25_12850 [Thiotrichales bacterium]|nr:hypothetical protein [Thiotrichales bacterium]
MNSIDPSTGSEHFSGKSVVEFILDLARLLTGENMPGWVSLVLVVALVGLSLWYLLITWRFVGAVRSVRAILRTEGDRKITRDRLVDIDREFAQARTQGPFYGRLERAWREFKETALPPLVDSGVLRNTVRPFVFFNREDLGLEAGIWRQVPALFVSVGLLLTFLGLVAALQKTGQILQPDTGTTDPSATVNALKELLTIASAKFIMSLTGLACSIVFTVVLRLSTKRKDEALHMLCADIERGCDFMSEQDVLREMLAQAKEQTTHLQAFSTDLVAQVARPLKEDLPNAIRESIGQAMQPVIDNISRGTNRGIESLVESVSGQLVEGVEGSVREMKVLMETVSTQLDKAAGRLDRSSETMAGNVDEAMGSLVGSVGRLSAGIDDSTTRLGKYAESIEGSATMVTASSEQLRESSESLSDATGPIRDSITEIQASTRSMRETSERTESILRHAHEVIEASHISVQDGLRTLDRSVTEFREVIGRYREIDDHLGDAFTQIETDLQASIEGIGAFKQKVNEEFGRALNRLEAVIAQAEPFVPVSEE